MLFSEIYGSYFSVLAAVLEEAVSGTLTPERRDAIAGEKAFAESALRIVSALETGEWPLLDERLRTPVKHIPTMPLTTLQKRWMKALLSDPRIRLFEPPTTGLEDVEPLYDPDVFVYFDRYEDGDPYGDERYIRHFRTILTALREGRKLKIRFLGGKGRKHIWTCVPHRLEYSSKDDKFRLVITSFPNASYINVARITSCALLEPYTPEEHGEPVRETKTLTLELIDERNALERAMLHFSHLEKETRRLDEKRYAITLRYDRDDEIEMLIRVLSFGPMLRVTSPESFIEKIRERLKKQRSLNKEAKLFDDSQKRVSL
ncbi:MAG: WYL domain-containing protein [Synergistaceae bacterium]|jgi:hypothetical protein|nr:WYL domain-containing protein [Synergistaceae bacterium]